MKFKTMKNAVVALALFAAASAQAGVVKVWGEELSQFNKSTINDFYNGLAGHSSSLATGSLDTVSLAGVNLLWATQPADDYSQAELTAMQNFLASGGRIAFLGEHGYFGAAENLRINSALSTLGSTISINNDVLDGGFHSASVADGQILSHSLTAGVDSYEYAAFAPLTISGSAVALMNGEQSFGGKNSVMMAYQNIGAGSIFLITDQNVWDNSPNWHGTFNNARMFENLLVGRTQTQVPEPGSIALLGLGIAGLYAARRRKAK